MHELGIVVHISKTLEELAQENNITDIRRVTLQIGKVSGIVPEYLVDCWKYYRKKVNVIKLRNGIFEGNTKNVLPFFCRKFEFFC